MLTHNVTGLRHCVIFFLLQNCQLFFLPFYYYYQLLYNIAALVANKVSYNTSEKILPMHIFG